MRCMVIVKATEDSENGVMPSEKDLSEMGSFNEELVNAGVMLDGAGLHRSEKGVRLDYEGDEVKVIDGPFAETKELIAGYWIWEVKNIEEAIEWAKRVPFNHGESTEIRPFIEPDEFGEELTPELRERGAALEAKIAEQRND
ncbi:MAG: YciI family protein [Solirubrobacterales bacterium]|nr:YciI family protein [Solirubrobacterales bacterium]OJU95065.1 MAG: dehydrogenase [Solirubrobacterales bacterium 67-14]